MGDDDNDLTFIQCKLNRADNTLNIIFHFIIPKSNDFITLRFQILSSFGITLFLIEMLTAIQFNYQLMFDRNEVNDITADGMLPSEIHPILIYCFVNIPTIFVRQV